MTDTGTNPQWSQAAVQPGQMTGTLYAVPEPAARKRAKWPRVIGTISIIFASLGLLSLFLTICCAFAAIPNYFKSGDIGFLCVSFLIEVIVKIFLLAGGIALVQRKEVGRKLHCIWAIILVCENVCELVLFSSLMGELSMMSIRYDPAGLWIGFLIVPALFSAYPIFVLIWMTRRFAYKELAKW